MQIDFHHTVTYVCARMAGFEHKDADIIAYSAQYVDDATNSGTVQFDTGAMYHRISLGTILLLMDGIYLLEILLSPLSNKSLEIYLIKSILFNLL